MPPLSLMGSLRWDVVERLLPTSTSTSVLEVGCGQGAVAVRLAERYAGYLGVELDGVSAQTATERLARTGRGEVRHGDLSVVEPGRTFDLVVAFEVIEHIEDDVAAAAEWVELVRPGGQLILSTPAYQRRYGPMDELVGHYRRYEPAALAELLLGAGLEDVSVSHYGAPLAYVIEPVRNVIARRRLRATAGRASPPVPVASSAGNDDAESVMAERTGQSGRTLQPGGRAAGLAIQAVATPVKLLQRRFPTVGPVLVAHGQRPPAR